MSLEVSDITKYRGIEYSDNKNVKEMEKQIHLCN